jgi:signal peptidase I
MRSSASSRRPATEDKPESVWSLARFFFILVLLTWGFRSFLIQPFDIPSGSMLPTLYIGDYLVVAKWPYGFSRYSFPFSFPSFDGRFLGMTPRRGDVVVFRHPTENADLIKRVIGLPGDTVAVVNGALILNGKPVPRAPLHRIQIPVSPNTPCNAVPPAMPVIANSPSGSVCTYHAFAETLPGGPSYTVLDQISDGPADNFGPVRIPPGSVFLMGDNRDDSLDSRFPTQVGGVGMVPVDHLIGRGLVTFWSTDGSASYWKPWTWFTALRPNRVGNGYSGVAH